MWPSSRRLSGISSMENLIEGLQREMKRNRELLEEYRKIPTGGFGAMVISTKIDAGEKAMAQWDTIAMITAYKELEKSG